MVGSVKMDLPHTGGWLELRKDTKDITVEADGFGQDKSDLARSLTEAVARKLGDK